MNAKRARVEGFLSLEQAAQQLDFSVSELSRQIEEGRVVAIVREGSAWLSTGEVTRLKRQSERASEGGRSTPAPLEGSRLHRASRLTASTPAVPSAESGAVKLSLQTAEATSSPPPVAEPEPLKLKSDDESPVLPTAVAEPASVSVAPLAESVAATSEVARETEAPPESLRVEPEAAPPVEAPRSEGSPSTAESVSTDPSHLVSPPAAKVEPAAPADASPSLTASTPATPRPATDAPVAPSPAKPPVSPPKPELTPAASEKPRPAAPANTEAAVVAQESSPPVQAVAASDRNSQQIRDLNKRCAELEARNQELDGTVGRLKSGLAETEATLKRNRIARGNLENEVIGLQDQLGKARTRSEALEREVQHLGAELDRVEEVHAGELRRVRSVKDRTSDASSMAQNGPDLEDIRQRMLEKDRLLTQEYEQRAVLRSQLEEIQQKYFELKALYDKEKGDWSEVFAKSVQNQNLLREQIEELKIKSNPKGWNPFRRDK